MKRTIMFETVTYAIKARKILSRSGFEVGNVKKINGVTDNNGCVYSLDIVNCEEFDVARLLRESDISYKFYH